MNRFQKMYILVFVFSLLGIIGNIELEVATELHCWLILAISSFFVLGKIIYLIKKGEQRWYKLY